MSPNLQVWQATVADAGYLRCFAATLVFLVGLHVAAPSAIAASEASRERAAKTACMAGEAAKGVAILAELYVKTGNPVFIFNQGRCYEQNGKYQEAIVRFREFLLKNRDAGNASDPVAEQHIATCQALVDTQRQTDKLAPSGPAPAPASPPATVAATSQVLPTAPPPLQLQAATSQASVEQGPSAHGRVEPLRDVAPSNNGRGLRVGGIAAMSVGAAAIATGIVLNVKANSLANEIESDTYYLSSKENTRASYETWSWVGYVVGGACLAGGAILYYLGYSRSRDRQIAFVPAIGMDSYGAALQGVF